MSHSQAGRTVQGLEHSPPIAVTTTAGAALTILTTVAGLQLIRLFISTLLFYLMDTAGLSIFAAAGVGALVFLASFLAAPLQRLAGPRAALALSAGGVALVRVVEQLVTSPPGDLALSIAGTVLFLLYVPLALGAARVFQPSGASGFGLVFLLGVAADSALHIAAGTYDLTWQDGLWPLAIVVVLAVASLVMLYRTLGGFPAAPAGVHWLRAWPLLAIGPWLALQLIVFQNTARAAALTGWSLPAAGLLITAGNIVGLAAAAWLGGVWPRRAALAAGAALVSLLVPAGLIGPGAALVVLAGQVLAAALLMRALSASATGGKEASGPGRSAVAYGLGYLLFTVLFFAYNAPNNLSLPYTSSTVLPILAFFVALAAAIPPASAGRDRPSWLLPALVIAAVLLLLAPAGLALTWTPAKPAEPAGNGTLRVMQYNLHNGFNVDGRLDMEALAAVIQAADPDVVTLQEVSRGWVITGSLDMLGWLANRLGMAYVPGPTTADGQWGNAILSRYPIVDTATGRLSSEGQALKRGYVQAGVDIGGTTVRVISTHLYQHINRPADSERRQVQVAELLAAWDNAPRTILVGDLNAWPEHPEMVMMAEAGLLDVAGLLAEGPGYTNPAGAPHQRIDYIWVSPDLEPESFSITQTTASDHLPLLAVLRIAGD